MDFKYNRYVSRKPISGFELGTGGFITLLKRKTQSLCMGTLSHPVLYIIPFYIFSFYLLYFKIKERPTINM